jgi:K+-transporting ATPase ATPase C chain
MGRQLLPALRMLAVLTVLCGVGYPVAVLAIGQLAFPDRADGTLLAKEDGTVVGSALIGQPFEGDEWFHPRPSAAGAGYDATASSSSNLGPTNPELIDTVAERADQVRATENLSPDTPVPVDAVTASGSGLDPHISLAYAQLQAERVARARDLQLDAVLGLVDQHTEGRALGFLGEQGVNVVTLNLALLGSGDG